MALFITSFICRGAVGRRKKYVKINGEELIYAQVPKKLANENFK